MWSVVYQIAFSARSVSSQMKGSYNSSCKNSAFNCDQTRQFKFNTKLINPMIFRCFIQNTYSHLAEHRSFVEYGLGIAVLAVLPKRCS